MANMTVWFELPTVDLDRAAVFYSAVFGFKIGIQEFDGVPMGFFPMEGFDNGGALVKGDDYKPSSTAATIYFYGGDDLSEPLGRVEAAGGKVVVPKTAIGSDMGYFAVFLDTEGNRVGLHSMK
jgi:uncharacterized protein